MSEDKDIKLEEKTEYDNFIGKKSDEYLTSTLEGFLGDDGITEPEKEHDWNKHWVGMPEYENNDNPSYKKITVSFRTKEDYDEFKGLISQPNMTEKTKSIWHPSLEKSANSLLRWIESDE